MTRNTRLPVGLCMIAALVLRLLDARGGLWLDEAWSVVLAREAAPFVGVFASINHDNNHHLNTLWVQLLGPEAPPLALRALAIVSGVVTVGVAAWAAARRGSSAAIVTAALFAVAPILVVYGSEARGYAPMLLAVVAAIALADRWLADPARPPPARTLAVVAAFGTLSHMTFIAALTILSSWTALTLRSPRRALDAWFPALFACGTIVVIVVGTAYGVAGGMVVGNYEPFSWAKTAEGLGTLIGLTTGLGLLGIAAVALLLVPSLARDRWLALCAALALALPLAVVLLHPGNSGYPRYYLLSALGLLLFAGVQIGALIDARGARRWLGVVLFAAMLGGSLFEDMGQIANQRGAPEAAIAAMAARAPGGAAVALDDQQGSAVLDVNAAHAHYRLGYADCRVAAFRFAERAAGRVEERWCGRNWGMIAAHPYRPPSGESWQLYVPSGLPIAGAAVTSPRFPRP